MNKKPDVPEELNVEAKSPVFGKEQILNSKRYSQRKDALGFLLQDGFDYSFAEVDRILNNYMKGQVK